MRDLKDDLCRRLRDAADAIDKEQAPDFLACMFLGNLFQTMVATYGQQFLERAFGELVDYAKTQHGVCRSCNGQLEIERTHSPMCAACDKRMDKSLANIDRRCGCSE